MNQALIKNLEQFSLYDHHDFKKDFVVMQDGYEVFSLYVNTMHCIKCVQKVENGLKEEFDDLDFQCELKDSSVKFFLPKKLGIPLSSIVKKLNQLGFEVFPKEKGDTGSRDQILRIGVAYFVFLNVMSFAITEYLAVSEELPETLLKIFHFASLGLTTISVFYCTLPLIKNGLNKAKRGILDVDQPIMVAILATYLLSCIHVLQGSGELYFDSVVAIIAFLLTGRWIQSRWLDKCIRKTKSFNDDALQFFRGEVKSGCLKDFQWKSLVTLKKGEKFLLLPGDVVPVDAKPLTQAKVNYEKLTGEPDSFFIPVDGIIKSGAIIVGSKLWCIAQDVGSKSELNKIKQKSEKLREWKSDFGLFSDKMSSVFFFLVFAVAVICLFTHWSLGADLAFTRSVAILLVACPCAFAVAAPLCFGRSLSLGLSKGIVFKSQRAIENLSKVTRIVFDKTGTLTAVNTSVSDCEFYSTQLTKPDLLLAIVAAKQDIDHHVLHAFGKYLENNVNDKEADLSLEVIKAFEIVGQGTIIETSKGTLKIGRPEFCVNQGYEKYESCTALVSLDQEVICGITLADALLKGSENTISRLQRLGFALEIISGDSASKTAELARKLNIDEFVGRATPSSKEERIRQATERVAMVGNGFNDMLALSRSHVGVAVHDSTPAARNSADVCLQKTGINGLDTAISLSMATRSALIRAFGFSAIYNVVLIFLAFNGFVSPMVAAVLMPINSIIVSLIAIRWEVS